MKASYFIIYPAYWTLLSISRQLEINNWLPSWYLWSDSDARYDYYPHSIGTGHSVGDCDSVGARCPATLMGLRASFVLKKWNKKIQKLMILTVCIRNEKIDGEFLLALSFAVGLCGPLLASDQRENGMPMSVRGSVQQWWPLAQQRILAAKKLEMVLLSRFLNIIQ